jgi:hypothetical protein
VVLGECEIERVIEGVTEKEGEEETDACRETDTEAVAVRLGVSDTDTDGVTETGGVTEGVTVGVTERLELIEGELLSETEGLGAG